MSNSRKKEICKALFDKINKEFDFDFVQNDSFDFASSKYHGLNILLHICIDFDNERLDSIAYDLKINDDETKNMSLEELHKALSLLKDYAIDNNRYFECCICKKLCKGYGNDPTPIKEKGKCCNECNETIVIPARLKESMK